MLAQRLFGDFDTVHGDDREMRRDAAALREIEQRRHQFAPGEVAGAAEDHKNVGFQSIDSLHGFHRFFHSVW
jgi:hypothetical protein